MNIKHPISRTPASPETPNLLLEAGAAFAHLRQSLDGRGPRLGVRVAGETADLAGDGRDGCRNVRIYGGFLWNHHI